MARKCDEIKVIRDSIHGYIHVDLKVVWDCINSKEFQRLRRIKQLGGSSMVYPTAEHSRFTHSLGVYEIVRRMVTENPDISASLTDIEKVTVMLAGLLHDIGHGPYSHAFEAIMTEGHETFTKRILLEDTEVHHALIKENKNLPIWICQIIDHSHQNPLLNQMISGQLDADRMDYLLRDAYFTGTKYGEFDLERLLRTLRVKEDRIVVKETGIHAVEDYIMARYHMYWQVYYHPTARSFEAILASFFERLAYLKKEEPTLVRTIQEFDGFIGVVKPSVQLHYKLDEGVCIAVFHKGLQCKDAILKDLAERLLNRRLFSTMEYSDSNMEKVRRLLTKKGVDTEYYLCLDRVQQRPYQPYRQNQMNAIWIGMDDGTIRELSQASTIVQSLVKAQGKEDRRIFYPQES